nr:hypothetical protein GCM10010200_019180 [Actinomadura rugatobispora]
MPALPEQLQMTPILIVFPDEVSDEPPAEEHPAVTASAHRAAANLRMLII